MAGTDNDPNRLPEWPLLSEVRAVVAQSCKSSEQTAEELILDYAHKNHRDFVYDCLWPEGAGGGRRGIDPLLWGFSNPSFGDYCPVDFDNSTVTLIRVPPKMEHGSEVAVVLKTLRKYSRGGQEFFPPIGFPYRLRLVRLHRDTVIAMLRSFGSLSPEPVQPAVSIPEQEQQSRASNAPIPVKPKDSAKQFVFDYMDKYPPAEGDHEYVDRVHGLYPGVTRKRISNLVSERRKTLRLPPAKQSSRNLIPNSRPVPKSRPGLSSRKR